MSSHERATYWQNIIDQWQESSLSGSRFCKERELRLGQFYYWSRKCSRKPVKSTADKKCSTGFATVVVADAAPVGQGLSFTLPNGCAIVGITSANATLIGAILAQL
jgi:hypothetical protein